MLLDWIRHQKTAPSKPTAPAIDLSPQEKHMTNLVALLLALSEEIDQIRHSDKPQEMKDADIALFMAVQQKVVDEYKAIEAQGFSVSTHFKNLMPRW